MKQVRCFLVGIVLAFSHAGCAIAEVSEVRIAQQYGFSYLQLMYMEKHRLLESQARTAGLGEVKVAWTQFGGGNAMNDALLSGSLDFASGGVAPPIVLWSKTVGGLGVKMVAAMTSAPLLLNTNNPNIKSLKDFTDKDKIALPAVKVSNQAAILAMAAAQQLGRDNALSLNRLTVSMSHPDGMTALLNGQIAGHFTAPPYQGQELKDPRVHTVLNSFDVMGGPLTFTVVWATTKFKNENPKTYAAFVAALKQATDMINRDKRAAAEFYVAETRSKEPVDEVYRMIADPAVQFTLTPLQIGKYAAFMYDSDLIKLKPNSWKDLFFENVHALPGS
jgi:NitT/TauT family transport system substrate-binding protein